MRFVVEPGFRVSGAEVSRDASSFPRRGPGMSFPPTPSRVPDSQKYIPVAFSDIVYRRPLEFSFGRRNNSATASMFTIPLNTDLCLSGEPALVEQYR